ncbi:DNA mismatch repair protein MutS [Desulfovibrio sp. OttesenSCG-928-G15]|nr:DNA mismatch repair protein MutS [Desulfovibrio sp. OttesenSCG-928-G15]
MPETSRAPLHPAPTLTEKQLTPMYTQYVDIKRQHEDALLFYRMGDFYELFFDDAIVASKALQITLTSRNAQADNPVAMCGVPHHSAESYIQALVEKGFKVAICEQVEDPRTAKGIVRREVIEVRTSGTTVTETGLEAKGHNFLGALWWDEERSRGGFAWVDYSTGEWSGLYARKKAEIWQWVQKMHPTELLLPDLAADDLQLPKLVALDGTSIVRLPMRAYFDVRTAQSRILEAQGVKELGALGLADKDELVRACGAIIAYLQQTQKRRIEHLKPFTPLNLSHCLIVDEVTERNLELFRRLDGKKGRGTLWHVLDETLTPMGGRLLEERLKHPWRDKARIGESADAVSFMADTGQVRGALREALQGVYDLERLSTRISLGRASPKDMVALGASLCALEAVRASLITPPVGQYASEQDVALLPSAVRGVFDNWDSLEDLAHELDRALVPSPPPVITEGGLFKPGYDAALDELLDLVEHGESRLQDLLAREQAHTGMNKLKLGYNRVFGYYLEAPKSQAASVPEYFVRRQTVANAERYITPELKELEEKLLDAGDSRKKLEYALFQSLREKVQQARPRILFMAESLAALDFWQGLAECSRKRGWCRPDIHDGTDIAIREGRHPVVEAMAGPAGFVPNDLRMDAKRKLLLITGPNMAGKSTVLRQAAIIVLLAQIGSHVPATAASIGLCDRIFSRVGASDNLAQGQSTFMVEMMETARILRQATKKSLVILDEIGRGTSTFDGLSLAWAVVEDLARRSDGGIRTLFATHYHELTALEGRLAGVHNMNIAIREYGGDIVFLRRLVPGPSDRSYGIEVARLAGVPSPVVQRAKKILGILESSRDTVRESSAQAMQQLLPGLCLPDATGEDAQAHSRDALLPPVREAPVHPLAQTLADLDTDNLTPMQALSLITEWKTLWGGEKA